MRGTIILEAGSTTEGEGLAVSVDMEDVNFHDRLALIHALAYSLEMSRQELVVVCSMYKTNSLEDLGTIERFDTLEELRGALHKKGVE